MSQVWHGSPKWVSRCASCGAKQSKAPVIGGAVILTMAGLAVFGVCVGSSSAGSAASAAELPSSKAPPSDDVEALLRKFGKPDLDESTAHDVPRPPIVTRWLVYK